MICNSTPRQAKVWPIVLLETLDLNSQNHNGPQPSAGKNVRKNSLPQEWPDQLSTAADIAPITKIPPVGEALLDFAAMPAVTFEQLCWWLLTKEQSLHGCQRLGKSGSRQGGIDLFAYDDQFPGQLNVYECKAWKDFGVTDLSAAVTDFLSGVWALTTRSFTLILAQREIGTSLALRWQVEKQRLKAAGIEADLWFSDRLTQKIQAYPDIISKFFPGAHVEAFGNIWMQRVHFFETVSKSVFDPRTAVAHGAKAFIAGKVACPDNSGKLNSVDPGDIPDPAQPFGFSIDGTFRRVSLNGRHWLYRGPWFSLSVMLPDKTSTRTSAAVDFNQGDLKGVTLTVDNDWLLKRFLFATAAPLTNTGRPFIVGPMPGKKDEYLIDFPNGRLSLGKDVVQELADVADLLTEVVRDELNAVESCWSAMDFPFVNRDGMRKVALACLRKDVWREVGAFTQRYDYENGSTPWHMFDGHRNLLKPCHRQANEHFDAGYHAVITSSNGYGLSFDDEVTLLWEPDDRVSNRNPSRRGWWPCLYAFEWLNNELLPAVKRSVLEREYGGWLKRLLHSREYREFSIYLDSIFIARDVRKPSLVKQGSLSSNIVATVTDLQYFFAGVRSKESYIRQDDVENLYRAVAELALGHRGFIGYVSNSLGLGELPENHADLIKRVNERLASGEVGSSAREVDYILRAMLELLNDTDAWLTEYQSESIKKWLLPFAKMQDDAMLVERHTQYS